MKLQNWLNSILLKIEQSQMQTETAPPTPSQKTTKYFIAVLLQLFLFFLSYQLKKEPEVAFSLLYLIVSVISTLVLGIGPGLVSAMMAAFSVNYHYVKPEQQAVMSFHSMAFLFTFMILYGLTVSLFAVLVEAVRRSVIAKKIANDAVFHREELLQVIAHDLRQPLGAAMMQIQLRQLGPEILGSLQRMDRLISDLLDSSKSEKGTLSLNLDEGDLKQAIELAMVTLAEMAKRKRIQVSFNVVDGEGFRCRLDMDRMVRVLVNLLGNAIKFTPSDGTIAIELSHRGTSEFQVRIQDSGPGVSEAEQKFLFTKSWQNQKTAHLGTGLGLFISKSIVEAHHGKIWHEPPPSGTGSIFAFTIPSGAQERSRSIRNA